MRKSGATTMSHSSMPGKYLLAASVMDWGTDEEFAASAGRRRNANQKTVFHSPELPMTFTASPERQKRICIPNSLEVQALRAKGAACLSATGRVRQAVCTTICYSWRTATRPEDKDHGIRQSRSAQ